MGIDEPILPMYEEPRWLGYLVLAALSLPAPSVRKVSPRSMWKSGCSFRTLVITF